MFVAAIDLKGGEAHGFYDLARTLKGSFKDLLEML